MGANEKVGAAIHPIHRSAIAGLRGRVSDLEAVAADLNAAGIATPTIRRYADHIQSVTDEYEAEVRASGWVDIETDADESSSLLRPSDVTNGALNE